MNNSTFTATEARAIGRVLQQIMFADGIVHPGEIEFLKTLESRIGLTRKVLKEAKKLTLEETIVVLKGMSFDQKSEVSSLLKEMSAADGITTPEEIKSMIEILAKADINIIH